MSARRRVLSVDVGTRNLAVAIVAQMPGDEYVAEYWAVIDLKLGVAYYQPLSVIGRNLVTIFNATPEFHVNTADVPVIIEQQEVSNATMICVSHMIATYFLTRHSGRSVLFISAAIKFKAVALTSEERAIVAGKGNYAARKKLAKRITVLAWPACVKHPAWEAHREKRDDLCDAFNQGVACLKTVLTE